MESKPGDGGDSDQQSRESKTPTTRGSSPTHAAEKTTQTESDEERADVTATNSKPRRKQLHHKVRSGCDTCKRRRVKCDEAKPTCKRCLHSGRRCLGYNVPKVWLFDGASSGTTVSQPDGDGPASASSPQLAEASDILDEQVKEISDQHGTQLSRPVMPLIGWTPEERRGLEFWISETGPTLANYGPNFEFWCGLIPRWASQSEDVRHLLIATTQLDEQLGIYRTATTSELSPVAISHYLAAIKMMATARQPNKISLTLACVLGWVFELLQRNYSAGQIHISAASRLLSELEATPDELSQATLDLVEQIKPVVQLAVAYMKAVCEDALDLQIMLTDGPPLIKAEDLSIPVAHSLSDRRDALLESTARYVATDRTIYAARVQRLYVKSWHRSLRQYCSRSKEESHLYKKSVQMLFNLGLAFLPKDEVGDFSYQATSNAIRHLLEAFERVAAENQKNKLESERGKITETLVMALVLLTGQLHHEQLLVRATKLLQKMREQPRELDNRTKRALHVT